MPTIIRHLSFSCLILASSLSWAADTSGPAAMPSHEQGQMQGKMHDRMQQRFTAMDTNGDGNISKAEFQANSDKHFAKMDTDGDGQITPQERSQLQQKMMQHKGQGGGPNAGQTKGQSFP
jgi:hypothetical protein